MGVAPGPHGMDAGLCDGGMGMNDARLDRLRAGGATGDARPEDEVAPNHLSDQPGVAPTRDWSGRRGRRSESSLVLQWFDEKGAIVRLLTSAEPDATSEDT